MKALQVLYLHGLGSSINNRTGQTLTELFSRKDIYFERFLYTNPGSTNKVWRPSEWLNDVEKRIKGNGNWLLIATSAGGHIALNAALRCRDNVKGLFLFCPGFDLAMNYVESLAPGAVKYLQSGKTLVHPASRNGNPALVDYRSFEEFLDMCVSQYNGKIPIKCPVQIVHGSSDDTVPYENSFRLANRIEHNDVEITIIDGGTHYLEIDHDILQKVEAFVNKINESYNSKL